MLSVAAHLPFGPLTAHWDGRRIAGREMPWEKRIGLEMRGVLGRLHLVEERAGRGRRTVLDEAKRGGMGNG
jgi:hypothetical protein